MNNELNEKLAKWAGFKRLPRGKKGYHWERCEKIMNWMPPHETEYYMSVTHVPNFAESLDACLKWLVPKIPRFMRVDLGLFTRWYCLLHQYKEGTSKLDYINEKDLETDYTTAVAETPTLAFCLAIEKLIDKELLNEQ